jgi:valyl-tRNA synthetase
MLAKHYNPAEIEPALNQAWQMNGIYAFNSNDRGPVYSVDTPPPTVSGSLHLGHVYSYSHADILARFWRMNGKRVYYPMGYDDNGLPTERLVEKKLGIRASDLSRTAFIQKCLETSEQAEIEYQRLWQRLGLSIDWRYTYRTIDEHSRRIAQFSFIDLHRKNLAYLREAPAIWCPECQTALAQADLNDLERESTFFTLAFERPNGEIVPIATTRPELLAACVAVFVHPEDSRAAPLWNETLRVPFYNHTVPVLRDPAVDPDKGTGIVMCCTFGDSTDVAWWNTYHLPLVEIMGRDGRLALPAGVFAGMNSRQARQAIVEALQAQGLVLNRQSTRQTLRVHERCDTAVEYRVLRQWFVDLLSHRERLLKAGEQINWVPEHMHARYRTWVENLNWDWCISRQRTYGVPFPVWYCQECGSPMLANESQLPVDPLEHHPPHACDCGSQSYQPETDVFDTWMTSSLTPQIVGGWLLPGETPAEPLVKLKPELYEQVFPFSLRPQAHEIIRTWAFYTIVKSLYHFDRLPWSAILISGWGIAGEGMEKISKSRGGGPMPPLDMIERYSADAVRYWAASTGPGKDAVISEEKIQLGARLLTKLWNVARFSQPFLDEFIPEETIAERLIFTPGDRWILDQAQTLIQQATELYQAGEYAAAKSEIENFFWRSLADNYLEMCKQRLYDRQHAQHLAGVYTLHQVFLTVIKLLAPQLPYICEALYLELYIKADPGNQSQDVIASIHTSRWPVPAARFVDPAAATSGELLVEIATAVRRFKSEHNLPLGSEFRCLQLASHPQYTQTLGEACTDLLSVTRARTIEFVDKLDPSLHRIYTSSSVQAAIAQ